MSLISVIELLHFHFMSYFNNRPFRTKKIYTSKKKGNQEYHRLCIMFIKAIWGLMTLQITSEEEEEKEEISIEKRISGSWNHLESRRASSFLTEARVLFHFKCKSLKHRKKIKTDWINFSASISPCDIINHKMWFSLEKFVIFHLFVCSTLVNLMEKTF